MDGMRSDPKFEVTRSGPGLGRVIDLREPQLCPLVEMVTEAAVGVCVGTDSLLSGWDLLSTYLCLPPHFSFPLLGSSRVDNEEEEEEREGGLELSGPPNPYQMHPPPEGCCTTDGEPTSPCVLWGPPGPWSPAGSGPACPPRPAALAAPCRGLSCSRQRRESVLIGAAIPGKRK